jgi:hypothetical protein
MRDYSGIGRIGKPVSTFPALSEIKRSAVKFIKLGD